MTPPPSLAAQSACPYSALFRWEPILLKRWIGDLGREVELSHGATFQGKLRTLPYHKIYPLLLTWKWRDTLQRELHFFSIHKSELLSCKMVGCWASYDNQELKYVVFFIDQLMYLGHLGFPLTQWKIRKTKLPTISCNVITHYNYKTYANIW